MIPTTPTFAGATSPQGGGSGSSRPQRVLPSGGMILLAALLGGGAAGGGAFQMRGVLPDELDCPVAWVLHGVAGGLLGLVVLHFVWLLTSVLRVPRPTPGDPGWLRGLLEASQETLGVRVVADDPRSAVRSQVKEWREQLADRAALVCILGGLVGAAWLFLFLQRVPLESKAVMRAGPGLLLAGVAESSLVLAGAAVMVAVGSVLWRRMERVGLRLLEPNEERSEVTVPRSVPEVQVVETPVVRESVVPPPVMMVPPREVDEDDIPPLPPE